MIHPPEKVADESKSWRRWAAMFAIVWLGGLVGSYLFVILMDPYGLFPFSIPVDRPVLDYSQRYMHAAVVTSQRFDSIVVGTSTSGLLEPRLLDDEFGGRFANLTMASATAWEQQAIINFFIRKVGPPKVLVVGLDRVWCEQDPNHNRSPRNLPEWMYDDNPWNDYLYMLNTKAVDLARRLVAYRLGYYRPPLRADGYQSFVPDESQYDLQKARQHIWGGDGNPVMPPENVPPALSLEERAALSFPTLPWLDTVLSKLPASSRKVLVFMPVHVAEQFRPGMTGVGAECKDRIAGIARRRGASLIDWRIPSVLTREDSNYWDDLHFRLPVADRIVRDTAMAVIHGHPSQDKTYELTVP